MKKRLLALLLTASMAISAVGCGGGNSEQGSSADKKPDQKKEAVIEKDVFIQPINSMPASLMPSSQTDDLYTITRPISDRLLAETKDGIEYYLADKLDVSEDGKIYTLHLNEKANWSDGKPITVDDILFTIDYAGRNSGGTSSYNAINGQPVKFNKKDDKTLEIVLPQPYSTYVRTLDQFSILPSHAFDGDFKKVDGSDYFTTTKQATSGAYVVSEINEDSIVFTARDDYYRGQPSIKKIIMKTIGAQNREIALENNEISYMRVTTAEQLKKYEAASDDYSLYVMPEARLNYLQINPLSDLSEDARKAIFLALNTQEIIDAAYGSDKLAVPANSLMTPEQALYDENCEGYKQNLEEAKKLAESSGLTKRPLRYIFNSDRSNMEAVATVVQQQLSQIGVKVEVQGMDASSFFPSFFYMWYGEPDSSWDIGSNGWDSQRGTDLGQSISYFKESFGYSKDIFNLAQQVNATPDLAKAKELASELQKKALDEYWEFPLTYTNYIMVSRKNVTGLDANKIIPEFNDYLPIKIN